MSNIQSVVNSLLARSADTDPVILTILQLILDEIRDIRFEIDPAPIISAKLSSAILITAPPSVTNFTYRLTNRNVILEWDAPNNDFLFYELRKGATWDTASRVLVTSNRNAILDPLTIGTHTYFIRPLNSEGEYALTATSVDVVIPELETVTIDAIVLDQNVLLRWNTPTSVFDIAYYQITRNGIDYTRSSSNFQVIVETAGGSYTYGVIPIDIAGNEGPTGEVTLILAAPSDFILYATQVADLDDGVKNNAKLEGTRLLLPVNLTETIEEHFLDNSWDSPQEQIDAGYPRWLTPTPETAYYEHIFDFGVVFSNVIVGVNYTFEIIEGSFTFGFESEASEDGVTYTGDYDTQNFFVQSARYIKVRINFTGNNDKALMWFSNFSVNLSVKEEMDSGTVIADAGDVNGTVVSFNKEYYDVTSITVSVKSTREPIDAIFSFNDVPNPTTFNVFAYDFAGQRVTKQVEWKARGII